MSVKHIVAGVGILFAILAVIGVGPGWVLGVGVILIGVATIL